MIRLVILLLVTTLVGCSKKPAPPPVEYTQTKLIWKGATAEEIADLVRHLSPLFQRIIIEDEQATLFSLATIEATMAEFDRIADRPYGIMISPPTLIGAKLPELPEVKEKKQIEWIAKPEVIATNGISNIDLVTYLKQLDLDLSAAAPLNGLSYTQSPEGDPVPLESIVDHKIITLNRPLIIQAP